MGEPRARFKRTASGTAALADPIETRRVIRDEMLPRYRRKQPGDARTDDEIVEWAFAMLGSAPAVGGAA